MDKELIHVVNDAFALQCNEADLIETLSAVINNLILTDFNKLISILYRNDVSEKKLNAILSENKNEAAGRLIAIVFIERQMQKLKTKQEYRFNDSGFDEEERW